MSIGFCLNLNLQLLFIIFRKIILLWGKPKDISIIEISDIPYKKAGTN